MKRSLEFGLKQSLLVLIAFAFCAASANYQLLAQIRPDQIMVGRGSVVYGDLKIEGEAVDGTFQVILYVGPSQFARQPIGSSGRYRFNGIPNGEYNLVVEFENQVIYRNILYLTATQPTDVRHDIVLTGRVASLSRRTSGVTLYSRSSANQDLYDKALAAIAKKQLDQAITSLNQLVSNDPKDFVAWTELGTVYFKQEKFAEAEKAYLQALEARPTFILALLNLGKLRLAQKNFDGAIEILTRGVAADPKSADTHHFLGEAYLGVKKGSKALGPLSEALKLDPLGKADIHLRLAALYNGAGMKDKAAMEYEQFLVKRPEYPEKKKLQEYITQNKKP